MPIKNNAEDIKLLAAITNGDANAWEDVVSIYQGRLLRFAQSKISQQADAQDLVQDAFLSFVRGIAKFRGEASIETYLYLILRNKIYDYHRSQKVRNICLAQDVYFANGIDDACDAMGQIPSTDLGASACFAKAQGDADLGEVLTKSLKRYIKNMQTALNFKDLKIAELLFYGQIPSKDTAKLLRLAPSTVRVFKHRTMIAMRESIVKTFELPYVDYELPDNLLTQVWESQRLSCPKYNTLGAFLLENLEPQWYDYVDFHLTTLGCHFCRASFKDLQHHQTSGQHTQFKEQILASTVGFITQS